MQARLQAGGKLSISPEKAFHEKELTSTQNASPHCGDADTNTDHSSDSIAAFVPEMHGAHAWCSNPVAQRAGKKVQQVSVTPTRKGELCPRAERFPGASSHTATCATPDTTPGLTPTHTPQKSHKRTHVSTPADLKKLLKHSLQASRLSEEYPSSTTAAPDAFADAPHRNRSGSADSSNSLHRHGILTDRGDSDRTAATGDPAMHAHAVDKKPLLQGRFAFSGESPDLSPAACILQQCGNNMHHLQTSHGSSGMQQGVGVSFGVGSNRNGCGLGNPPHVQLSGLSGTQLDMHALGAVRALRLPQAQGMTALQQAADMCAVLGGHHAAHAGASDVGDVQSHNTQSTPADTSLHTVQMQLPGISDPRMLQPHRSAQHASDMESTVSTVLHTQKQGHLCGGVTATSSAAVFHTFDAFEQQNVAECTDVLTNSVGFNSMHSCGSSQGEILHTIADMRRTLQEDLGASPSQQRLSPHDLQTPQTSLTSPQMSPHKRHPQRLEHIHTVVHAHQQQLHAPGVQQTSAAAHAASHPRTGPPEQSHRPENGISACGEVSVTTDSSSCPAACPAGQLRSVGQHPQERQATHLLGRCHGATRFTPSPHPKQKQSSTVEMHALQSDPTNPGASHNLFHIYSSLSHPKKTNS
jgi:hypothetical protein